MPVEKATAWIARFLLVIPKEGDSLVPQLRIIPRTSQAASLAIAIYAEREIYRQFTVHLTVAEAPHAEPVKPHLATIRDEVLHTPAAHLNLRPAQEWMTPPGELSIAVTGSSGMTYVRGDVGPQYINQSVPWFGAQANVAGPIQNVRAAAERFRARWEDYLNRIDPEDLAQRLRRWSPDSDWTQLGSYADPPHQTTWEAAQISPELQELAFDGHVLYAAFFPPGSALRRWLDKLTPVGYRMYLGA